MKYRIAQIFIGLFGLYYLATQGFEDMLPYSGWVHVLIRISLLVVVAVAVAFIIPEQMSISKANKDAELQHRLNLQTDWRMYMVGEMFDSGTGENQRPLTSEELEDIAARISLHFDELVEEMDEDE